MKVNLIGTQSFTYNRKSDGKPVSMCVLHTTHPRNGVVGISVEEVRVYAGSACFDQASNLVPPCELDVDFDSRGFVVGLTVLAPQAPEKK